VGWLNPSLAASPEEIFKALMVKHPDHDDDSKVCIYSCQWQWNIRDNATGTVGAFRPTALPSINDGYAQRRDRKCFCGLSSDQCDFSPMNVALVFSP
jgi:nicotinamidase-related amidase